MDACLTLRVQDVGLIRNVRVFHSGLLPSVHNLLLTYSSTSILVSRPFKFIVGADEVPIVVHETAFADQSSALPTLMRGMMSESLAGEAKWKDVDIGTFIRFAQFAYTGDYSIPRNNPLDPGQEIVEEAPPPLMQSRLHLSNFGTLYL